MNEFPDLRNEPIIAIDIETYDPDLTSIGMGAFRSKAYGEKHGYILGIGLSTANGFKHYYSLRHPDSKNYSVADIAEYLNRYVLQGPGVKIGANLQYELAWLHSIGVEFKGPLKDVQIAEPLIDEERPDGYSLASLLNYYFPGRTKGEELLYVAAEIYGVKDTEIKQNLYLFPSQYVGPYCIQDATDCLDLIKPQEREIARQSLEDIYRIENQLVPILFEIRKYGVRVDVEKAAELNLKFENEQMIIQNKLDKFAGQEVDIWSGDNLSAFFDKHKIPYNRTKKATKKNPAGAPSFIGKWLENHAWEPANWIGAIRKIDRLRETYIGNIAKYNINGRVHAQINQLASDDYGTRTGRMSCSDPNLYQIPNRGPLAKHVRALFLPDEDDGQGNPAEWVSHDYSQQEPRILVHYANLMKLSMADEFTARYQDPSLDFHNLVLDWINMEGLTRDKTKAISLGSFYAMGKAKIIANLGVDAEEGDRIFKTYHAKLPFVKQLEKECIRVTEARGYIITLLGRRRHFDMYEPNLRYPAFLERKYDGIYLKDKQSLLDNLEIKIAECTDPEGKQKLEQAYIDWKGPLKRAYCYKSLNALIQGSAADMLKKSMIQIYEEFGHVRYLQIQVYDEIAGSYGKTKQGQEDKKRVREIMENVITLKVPLRADTKSGASWGECVKEEDED